MERDNEKRAEDDEIFMEEEETEEEFRKRRHQRELFLKKNSQRCNEIDEDEDDDQNIFTNSELFKISQKVLKRTISSTKNDNKSVTISDSQESSLNVLVSFL